MNLHTTAVIFHTPQAKPYIARKKLFVRCGRDESCSRGWKIAFISLFICVDSWRRFLTKCSGHNVQSLVHLDITLWMYLFGERGSATFINLLMPLVMGCPALCGP